MMDRKLAVVMIGLGLGVLAGCGKSSDDGAQAGAGAFSSGASVNPTVAGGAAGDGASDALVEIIAKQMVDKGLAQPAAGLETLRSIATHDEKLVVTISNFSCIREPGAHGGPPGDALCDFDLGQHNAPGVNDGDPENGEAGWHVQATISRGVVTEGSIKLTAG
jgi:hypothetical protein